MLFGTALSHHIHNPPHCPSQPHTKPPSERPFPATTWITSTTTSTSTLCWTATTLHRCPPPAPAPALGGFGGFSEPSTDWQTASHLSAAPPLGNADLSGAVPDALTDGFLPGSLFPDPGWGVEVGQSWPLQDLGAEKPGDFGELSSSSYHGHANNSASADLGLPASHTIPSGMDTKIPSVQGFGHKCVRGFEECHQSLNTAPLPRITCDWPSCKSVTIYGTIRELQNHQTDVHIAEVLKAWPGSCSWPGCSSKIFFKTSKRLESHVYNIHITPLCCTVVGCKHKRPFERPADLERHVASTHTKDQKYKCRYPWCSKPYRFFSPGPPSFSRKDKLRLHERTYHGQFACQLSHCMYGFPSEEKLWEHESYHSFYECRLGSCEHTSISRFYRYELRDHLQHDHMISNEGVDEACNKLGLLNRTITLAHFPCGIREFQDCDACIKKLKKATPSINGK